ncbi:diguanylate cyclase [Pikeienuella piscinae]|uniref:diguanylate cyclase n=1 Tax=Pikeienuella piscinae TaxID=2748098 RepID=A0A7L5BUG9_9RHOB|nr:diguanylate cyclase [Pikeienuella piscinae]QIE55910.1 diguanylate cyclase [Pikeienuella piscinae]
MSGRILVIDRDARRRGALGGALEAAYFDVVGVAEACDRPPDGPQPDLVLCDFAPGCAGAARLSAVAADPALAAPVLAISEPGSAGAAGALNAGAEDHLEWPVASSGEPALLIARARRLIRARIIADELELRQKTARDLGLEPTRAEAEPAAARVLLIAPPSVETEALTAAVVELTGVAVSPAPSGFAAMRMVEAESYDAVIVADGYDAPAGAGFAELGDAVGIIAALHARPETRDAAIIHLSGHHGGRPTLPAAPLTDAPVGAPARRRNGTSSGPARARRAVAAFEAGATDSAPSEAAPLELAARLCARLRAKRRADALRAGLEGGMRLAAIDPLTGLHNRRYFDLHVARLCAKAESTGAPLAALVFDLDRFKDVNDAHGHAAGDEALRAFAHRLRAGVRGADLVARTGGEEFAVILQNARQTEALAAAERVRAAVSGSPVAVAGDALAQITVSIGVASLRPHDEGPAALLWRADAALRAAKREGRDRVRVDAA